MTSRKNISVALFTLLCIFIMIAGAEAGGTKTFPKGTYILPQDICWQPNKDTKTVEICGNGLDDDGDCTKDEPNSGAMPATYTNTTTCTAPVTHMTSSFNCYDLTGCDTDKNDQGTFQATGLVYDILRAGFPIYWVISPSKTSQIGVDMSITKSAADPAVTIYHSLAKTDSGTVATVKYTGGPFVIDANDMDPAIQDLFDKYPNAKIHKSNYDFSAEVDKVLSGIPPKVAVLGGSKYTYILTDYLFASGLGNNLSEVFQYLTPEEIIAGGLKDYQLLWAPHWEIDSEITGTVNGLGQVDRRNKMLAKVNDFLVAGNAGFFECASIASMERTSDAGSVKPSQYYTGQGLLLASSISSTWGRAQEDGVNISTTTDKTKVSNRVVAEKPTSVLTQCGGWRFVPDTGLTENIRPHQGPEPDYTYNATVDRFIHDPDNMAITGYDPKGYDFYLGGRINGNATAGYVVYLGGHNYVSCSTANMAVPTQRLLDFEFSADLNSPGSILMEVVHTGCIAGSTCPLSSFSLPSMAGTSIISDPAVYIDTDSAQYGPDADPATKFVLSKVKVGNLSGTADQTITSINVTFDGNAPTMGLKNIVDVTNDLAPVNLLCSFSTPSGDPTPASCPSVSDKSYKFNFSSALFSSTTITIEAIYGACTEGLTGSCPKGTYDLTAAKGTSGDDGVIKINMSAAAFDAASFALTGVSISNLSAAAKTLTRFNVYFPDNGAKRLTSIEDTTGAASTICTTPTGTSPAQCPPTSVTSVPSKALFEFNKDITTGTIYVEAVFSGCTQGVDCPKALYSFKWGGTTNTASNVQIDMRNASFDHSSFYLRDVELTNNSGANITITKFVVTFPAQKLKKIRWDGNSVYTNSSGIASWGVPITLNLDPDPVLKVAVTGLSLNITIPSSQSQLNIKLGKAVSSCDVNWSNANTCGMKFVLNTLVGLQFQVIPQEYAKAGSITENNIMYKATFEYPGYAGHLYAIDVLSNPAIKKWDAGANSVMPPAGTVNPAAPSPLLTGNRYIFTNIPGTSTVIPFGTAYGGLVRTDTTKLWYYLDPMAKQSRGEAFALIQAVRGRKNTSETVYNGTAERSKRLGGIEHSTPAVMTRSKLVTAATATARDKIVFAGGDDGMLHAFFAGHYDVNANDGIGGYSSAGTGREIWAYIPGNLLGSLQNQTFTDCSPGETIDACDPLTDPNKCVCPIFSVAVTVDGSPALGDFYVDHDNDPATSKEYRTILVATAKIMTPGASTVSVNQGIIFSLDVTDPYNPELLWERTFNTPTSTLDICSLATFTDGTTKCTAGQTGTWADGYLHYYPSSSFTNFINYPTNEKTTLDPNMGDAKGVAIGRVQVGTTLDTFVFVTSRWVRQVDTRAASGDPAHNVWGMNVYALDFATGNIRWVTKIAYTGDAEGVNESPAAASLIDMGDNGTYDYLAVGDMQGRLWVLKTVDGTTYDSKDAPAFDVGKGAKEPIGVPVSVSGTFLVFGTGGRDSLADEDTTKYHVYALEILNDATINVLWNPPYELKAGEKIWSSPLIDQAGTVYVGTATGYTDVGQPDLSAATSSGRLLMLDLKTGTLKKDALGVTIAPLELDGAVIGQMTLENNHLTIQQFNGKAVQIGSSDEASFTSTVVPENPVKVLWWRKL